MNIKANRLFLHLMFTKELLFNYHCQVLIISFRNILY